MAHTKAQKKCIRLAARAEKDFNKEVAAQVFAKCAQRSGAFNGVGRRRKSRKSRKSRR